MLAIFLFSLLFLASVEGFSTNPLHSEVICECTCNPVNDMSSKLKAKGLLQLHVEQANEAPEPNHEPEPNTMHGDPHPERGHPAHDMSQQQQHQQQPPQHQQQPQTQPNQQQFQQYSHQETPPEVQKPFMSEVYHSPNIKQRKIIPEENRPDMGSPRDLVNLQKLTANMKNSMGQPMNSVLGNLPQNIMSDPNMLMNLHKVHGFGKLMQPQKDVELLSKLTQNVERVKPNPAVAIRERMKMVYDLKDPPVLESNHPGHMMHQSQSAMNTGVGDTGLPAPMSQRLWGEGVHTTPPPGIESYQKESSAWNSNMPSSRASAMEHNQHSPVSRHFENERSYASNQTSNRYSPQTDPFQSMDRSRVLGSRPMSGTPSDTMTYSQSQTRGRSFQTVENSEPGFNQMSQSQTDSQRSNQPNSAYSRTDGGNTGLRRLDNPSAYQSETNASPMSNRNSNSAYLQSNNMQQNAHNSHVGTNNPPSPMAGSSPSMNQRHSIQTSGSSLSEYNVQKPSINSAQGPASSMPGHSIEELSRTGHGPGGSMQEHHMQQPSLSSSRTDTNKYTPQNSGYRLSQSQSQSSGNVQPTQGTQSYLEAQSRNAQTNQQFNTNSYQQHNTHPQHSMMPSSNMGSNSNIRASNSVSGIHHPSPNVQSSVVKPGSSTLSAAEIKNQPVVSAKNHQYPSVAGQNFGTNIQQPSPNVVSGTGSGASPNYLKLGGSNVQTLTGSSQTNQQWSQQNSQTAQGPDNTQNNQWGQQQQQSATKTASNTEQNQSWQTKKPWESTSTNNNNNINKNSNNVFSASKTQNNWNQNSYNKLVTNRMAGQQKGTQNAAVNIQMQSGYPGNNSATSSFSQAQTQQQQRQNPQENWSTNPAKSTYSWKKQNQFSAGTGSSTGYSNTNIG